MSVKLDPCPTRMRRLRRFNAAGTAFLRPRARSKVVERKRDSLGRRCEKKVSVDGETTFHQRCAYRNYLQIAAFDVSVDSETEEEVLSLATTTAWDPMEPQATRPLAFTEHSGDAPATYFHTHDLTKNVCELIDSNGAAVSACDCAPFGAVAISGTPTRNPFQFSSEVYDPETALVYYNYRHYNPLDGRWISRDFIGEDTSFNLYLFLANQANNVFDRLGNARYYETGPRLFIQGVVATPASSTLPDMVSGLELATLSLRNLINMSHIISEINKCLSEAGWGICQCCCLIMLRCVLNYDQKYTIVKSTSFLEHMSCEDAWEYERGQTIREYIPHLENIDVRIPIYCKKQA